MNRCLCEEMLKRESHWAYLTLTRNKTRCWYDGGIVELPPLAMAQLNAGKVTMVNMRIVNDENVIDKESGQVLDLNDDGERWEGGVLNDEPYGWGVLYDSENRMVYKGFRIGEVNVCYGIQYYSDIQKMEYEGEWCEGKRWGRGTQYDRDGNTVFSGEWMNDRRMETRVVITIDNPEFLLHNHVEQFIVSSKCCNEETWKRLDLSFLSNLQELAISDCCFQNVEEVELIGLSKLERVAIGNSSFSMDDPFLDYRDPSGHFYLKNCDRLRELKIGYWSFYNYAMVEIENMARLEVIEIGDLDGQGHDFLCASLELKSASQRMK